MCPKVQGRPHIVRFHLCENSRTGKSIEAESRLVLGLPCGSAAKESACNARDLGSISWPGRSPGEGKGYPLQYSGLENSMDCVVHEVAKSQIPLSDFHFHFQGLREGGWGVTV